MSARPLDASATSPRPERSELRLWESAVERQIREAQERGDFDGLPGLGRPLPEEPWEGDWALAFHILRLSGETLPWITLGRDIEERQARLKQLLADTARRRGSASWPDERVRARRRYLREAAELDTLLDDFNFLVPTRSLDKGRLPPHVAERQFDAACPP